MCCLCVEQISAEQKKSLLFRPVDLVLTLLLLAAGAFSVFRGFVSETTWNLLYRFSIRAHLRHEVARCSSDAITHSRSAPGGAGLSSRRLFHLHLPVRALPQRPSGLSQGHGESGGKMLTGLNHTYWFFVIQMISDLVLQMLVYLFYAVPLLTVFIYGLRTPGCSWMLDWTVFFAAARAQVTFCPRLLPLWTSLGGGGKQRKVDVLFSSPLFSSLRPSGATSEHLCTPALPSRTDSQQTSGGPLSASTCCSSPPRLCSPCAATAAPLILWNLFPRDRPTTRRRKTRPHTNTHTHAHNGHGLSRNTSRCDKANVFWGHSMAHKLH